MNNTADNMVLYDWVPFFQELSTEISKFANKPERDNLLKEKAEESFGEDSRIVSYNFVDPFSFIYHLAQRNTKHKRHQYYSQVKESFQLNSNIPTDWIYPTPTPNTTALFHDAIHFETNLLWDLFVSAVNNEDLNNDLFLRALKIKTVKTAKLTQTLFLINPFKFIAIDNNTLSLPIFEEENRSITNNIENIGFSEFSRYLKCIRDNFPGCHMYEINLFAYKFTNRKNRVNNIIYQISSNANNTGDELDSFYKKNAVWTGWHSSENRYFTYPVEKPSIGDIIIIRTGRTKIRSICVVIENEYKNQGKWSNDSKIKIIRLTAETKEMPSNSFTLKEAMNKISKEKEKIIRNLYQNTFNMLDKISGRSDKIANINKDQVKNLILQGPPGTGKTRLAKQIALYLRTVESSLTDYLLNPESFKTLEIFNSDPIIDKDDDKIKIVQFHPSYTYEDFVRGIITSVDNNGKVHYEIKDKILLDIASDAIDNPTDKYILIIDEINRSNLPSVLGELIYALEYRGEFVECLYEHNETKSKQITIPENLYIIGTMNTADRSIGHIDYAIRRRFVFKDVKSDIDILTDGKAKSIYSMVDSLFSKEHLAPDFLKADIMLGHSYFLTNNRTIEQRLLFEIIPILKEYVKDGILIGKGIVSKIDGLLNNE